jgi:hypothetical protein
VVFIDPDNGLEIGSVGPYHARGPKYAFYEDLRPLIERGQSLVVYQHVNRTAPGSVQAASRMRALGEHLSVQRMWAVRFRRGSGRLYIVIPALEHEAVLAERTAQLLASEWGQQGLFQPVPEL